MAFTFTTNLTPTTGCDVWYQWKTLVKTNTWIVKQSGDGLSAFSSTTDIITSTTAGSVANSWQNTKAWVQIAMPNSRQQLVVQRGTTNLLWRIKLSPLAGFIGGAPSSTVTPSATDEVFLCGGGTDASPTFSTLFAANGTYRCQIGADAASPWGTFFATYPSGGGNPNGGFMIDPLSISDGSDPDPYVYYTAFASANAYRGSTNGWDLTTESGTASASGIRAYLGPVATTSNFVACPTHILWSLVGSTAVQPGGTPVSPFSNLDSHEALRYIRRTGLTAPVGWKGASSLLQWHSPGRSTGDTESSKARIIIGEVSLPWDSSTTPLV